MQIEFNEEAHIYTVDGVVFPSVTQVLGEMGFYGDTSYFTDYGRNRGTLAHLCCHLDDTGELDEGSVDPTLAPYLAAYRRFKSESGFIVSGSEVRLASAAYRFAGTLDKIGTFPDITCAIIDIKSGAVVPATAIQTAAYELLKGSPYKRFALQLKPDGSFKLHKYTDRQDKQIFLAALAAYQWQENHNIRRAA